MIKDNIDEIAVKEIEVVSSISGNMSFKYGPPHEVKENRKNFLKEVENITGVNLLKNNKFNGVIMKVVNGYTITMVDDSDAGRGFDSLNTYECDSLIVRKKQFALGFLAGDCVPLVLYCPESQTLSLTHISRLNIELVERILDVMVSTAITTTNISKKYIYLVGVIGPSIKKESYYLPQLPPALAHLLKERGLEHHYENEHFDLPGIVKSILNQRKQSYIDYEVHIDLVESPIDTATHLQFREFSHFHSIQENKPEKRFLVLTFIK